MLMASADCQIFPRLACGMGDRFGRSYPQVARPELTDIQSSGQQCISPSLLSAPGSLGSGGRKLIVKNRVLEIAPRPWKLNGTDTEQEASGASQGSYRAMESRRESQQARSATKSASKKKSTGVLGFLTLKEPSTSALDEFAEQERRKLAAHKGSFLSGVNSQKIPDHVPKVNSKPTPIKRKATGKDRAARNSATSLVGRSSEASARPGAGYGDSCFRTSHETVKARPSSDKKGIQAGKAHGASRIGDLLEAPTQLHSSPSPPVTPRALERSDSLTGLFMPTTPESCPRTPHFEGEQSIMLSRYHVSVMSSELGGAATTQLSKQPKVQHRTRSSGNDIAPWEAFEPPERKVRKPKETNAHAEKTKTSRIWCKTGIQVVSSSRFFCWFRKDSLD